MQAANVPAKFPIPFANDATSSYSRVIPLTSADTGAASLTLGYPPKTFLPLGGGGQAMDGRDENGILNQISSWAWWQGAGGPIIYDAALSVSVAGYPKGAVVQSATTFGVAWLCTADNNVTDPDAGGGGWTKIFLAPQQFAFAGNPNGNVAGIVGAPGISICSICEDTTTGQLWACTTTGNAAAAVWTRVGIAYTLPTASSTVLGGVKVGSGLSITGGVLSASGGGGAGTVTSIGVTPPASIMTASAAITTAGSVTLTLKTQGANFVFAGPASGLDALPTFRNLVSADYVTATTLQKGAVQPDGTTLVLAGAVLSAAGATTAAAGIMRPDNLTVIIDPATLKISAVPVLPPCLVVGSDANTLNVALQNNGMTYSFLHTIPGGVAADCNIAINDGDILPGFNITLFNADATFNMTVSSTAGIGFKGSTTIAPGTGCDFVMFSPISGPPPYWGRVG